MGVFSIPESGLVLDDCSRLDNSKNVQKFTQVMQLDLADGTIDEMFKCARKGNPIHVAFGKTIVSSESYCHRTQTYAIPQLQSLQYGTKQRHLDATAASSNIDIFSSDNRSTVLQLAGRVSHTLAMQKAEETIASTDGALAKLQSSLASAKQAKESNQYVSLR